MEEQEKKRADFLMLEYGQISDNLRTFWNLRMTAIGVFITLLGYIVLHQKETHYPEKQFFDLFLVSLLWVLVLIARSLTKTMTLYLHRMKKIANIFKVNDFWTTYLIFVQKNRDYSATTMVNYTLLSLNFIVPFFVVVTNAVNFEEGKTRMSIVIIDIVIAAIICLYNVYKINTEVNIANQIILTEKTWNSIDEP
ncbi:MAG: hypothetical protein JWO06_1248 [Bacteroidota bacterium]|nr:hypothetical protein [Bacteroidota bacterium]